MAATCVETIHLQMASEQPPIRPEMGLLTGITNHSLLRKVTAPVGNLL